MSKRVKSIASEEELIEAAPIMPGTAPTMALGKLCPDFESWPQRWRGDDADIAPGERIVECFTPFLLHLLGQGLAAKTLHRHRDHLSMLGGEITRRLHDDPVLRRKPMKSVILQLTDDECGPLIWPRITEQQQDSFDATCRKLRQFLKTNPKPSAK